MSGDPAAQDPSFAQDPSLAQDPALTQDPALAQGPLPVPGPPPRQEPRRHEEPPPDPAAAGDRPHDPRHPGERHGEDVGARLNWLRAGVLGANDGVVSVAGLVMGVAGASSDRIVILTAGVAGLVAGALSMAGGEYVSVSSQRDTERALLRLERWELAHLPGPELAELARIYMAKGLSPHLARQVAEELTRHDALTAHAEAELGIDPASLTSPWTASFASFASFVVGALLPLLAITLPPASVRAAVCVAAVVAALALTGTVSARLGRARPRPAILRNVGVGLLAMAVTYAVGTVVGTTF